MTAVTVAPAPEVAAAREALARVPEQFMNDRLAESAIRRATLQAMHRELGTRAAMHEISGAVAADALAKVADGDLSALDELVAAQAAKDAAGQLRKALVIPELDPDAVALALQLAERSLLDSETSIRLPALAFDAETVAWRQACEARRVTLSPPLPCDLDRAASRRAASMAGEISETISWHIQWREHVASPSADHLGLLAAAGGVLEQRAELAVRVRDVAALIAEANAARRAAGLNWTVPA